MSTTVGVLGSAFLSVTDTDETYSGPHRVGFLVSTPSGPFSLNLLASTTITTYQGSVEQESGGGNALQPLSQQELSNDPNRRLLLIETSLPFDRIQLDFGATAGELANLDVYAACVGPPPPE